MQNSGFKLGLTNCCTWFFWTPEKDVLSSYVSPSVITLCCCPHEISMNSNHYIFYCKLCYCFDQIEKRFTCTTKMLIMLPFPLSAGKCVVFFNSFGSAVKLPPWELIKTFSEETRVNESVTLVLPSTQGHTRTSPILSLESSSLFCMQ